MSNKLIRIALAVAIVTPLAAQAQTRSATEYEHAVESWDKGNYPDALERLTRIMRSADASNYRDRIALLTGELYRTTELTLDGRAPRWSPDGRWAAFEAGAGRGRITRMLSMKGNPTIVGQVAGSGLVFSREGRAAYLDSADALVVRELANGAERRIAMSGRLVASLAYSSDGRTLYAVGVDSANQRGTRIFAIDDAGVTAIANDDSVKTSVVAIPGGRFLLHSVGGRSPFARGAQGGPPPQASGFALLDLTTHTTRYISGSSPSVSADGSAVAWVAREGADYTIVTMSLPDGAPVVARRATYPLAAPSLSTDSARRVAYQVQANHDWEIYVADRDGRNELRLTREIQHDLQPRFVNAKHILAVMGEARHRRSYLLHFEDTAPPNRTRLFHNNTIRTIAPEYEWAPSPDGTKILIVAERDGDTVSPERGVYLFDMSEQVTSADVLARLAGMTTHERDLRALGTRAFAPIAADVRARVAEVSVPRIYSYEKALFDFDSKHVTQRGNIAAIDYLFRAYRSFGYAPEGQEFQARVGPQATNTVNTANILATLRGTVNPELIYVVGSHFDSRAEGPGADDNTSGTAALLEAARVLSKHPQPATIVFVSFSAEESGLLGSREFARVAVEKKWKVVGALNNDMLGWTNDHRLDNTIRYSNPGIRDVQHGAAIGFTNMITYDALYYKSTDAAAMYDAWGDIVGGIGSYPVLGNPHYHQSHDNLEVENHQLIAEASKTTVATLMLMASSPSRIASLTATPIANGLTTLAWAPSPESGVKRYIVRVSSPGREDRMISVSATTARLTAARAGDGVAVKAVNAKGMEGWDWARITLK